jgi:predicted alpha/beta-hydrolase family hydrolase
VSATPASSWRIPVGDADTTAAWDPPASGDPADRPVFVCAHGAGGHMGDRLTLAMRDHLVARGIGVVRFDFLYRARRLGRPDPMPRLVECLEAVVAHVRRERAPRTLVLGGRSMGGRAASMFVAGGGGCDGLLLLAYPLHPPGQPGKLRDGHLPAIRQPVLCLNGTRDAFCDRPLMETVLARLGPNWRMHWLEGADHGFHVLKSSGRTDPDVMTEAADAIASWVAPIAASVSRRRQGSV